MRKAMEPNCAVAKSCRYNLTISEFADNCSKCLTVLQEDQPARQCNVFATRLTKAHATMRLFLATHLLHSHSPATGMLTVKAGANDESSWMSSLRITPAVVPAPAVSGCDTPWLKKSCDRTRSARPAEAAPFFWNLICGFNWIVECCFLRWLICCVQPTYNGTRSHCNAMMTWCHFHTFRSSITT